jgi:hypothetical protein
MLPSDSGSVRWITAIRKVDQAGEQGELLAMLRSPFELTPEARFHLADLIDRYGLRKRTRGSEVDPDFGTGGLIGRSAVPLLDGADDDEEKTTKG